ncbi:MAG TPA: hypothetical protein VMU97_00915 [Candidatus Dormibacteraeota bacterium]|nr:hypothetical protein [Candidatus Dormibacteraeota bacterium]HVA11450.1 hypothetical protein [Candidatus Dormibacteraeota bacterium]
MKDLKRQLRKELLAAGATAAEAKELQPIAAKLSLLKGRNAAAGNRPKTNRWRAIVKPAVFVASGLVLGMFVIITSQAALPGSWLYPAQKFSDSVAISIHPQYRANVMMKRAQQVNQLVAQHASSERVLATLADYTAEASAYKDTPHANYAAFEYCKTNLRQAASAAPPDVRQAISISLQSLENT